MGADPISLAMLAATAVSAVGSIKGGNAEYKAGMYEAAADEENARFSELDGAYEESKIRREERQTSGDAIAAMGAGGGVQLGTGSALELLRENAYNSEFDALSARYTAATQARNYRLDAVRQRAGARQARTAGFMRAGAQILQGASQMNSTSQLARAGAAERAARTPSASGLSMPVPFRPFDGGRGY